MIERGGKFSKPRTGDMIRILKMREELNTICMENGRGSN